MCSYSYKYLLLETSWISLIQHVLLDVVYVCIQCAPLLFFWPVDLVGWS